MLRFRAGGGVLLVKGPLRVLAAASMAVFLNDLLVKGPLRVLAAASMAAS